MYPLEVGSGLSLNLGVEMKIKSIFDVLPYEVFALERNAATMKECLDSNNCYEHYYNFTNEVKPKSILEIGVRHGYSLCSMFVGAQEQDVYLEGWDLEAYENNSQKIAEKNLLLCGAKNYKLLICDSQKQTKIDKFFDIIHVDGDHTYEGALHDLELCTGKCKYIIVDDYTYYNEVKQATDFYIDKNQNIIQNTKFIDSYRGTMIITFK